MVNRLYFGLSKDEDCAERIGDFQRFSAQYEASYDAARGAEERDMDLNGENLANKIVPSRQAAMKASTSFADQLGSSPTRASDDEHQVFGGSSALKKGSSPVKYGSRRKNMSGPVSVSHSRPIPTVNPGNRKRSWSLNNPSGSRKRPASDSSSEDGIESLSSPPSPSPTKSKAKPSAKQKSRAHSNFTPSRPSGSTNNNVPTTRPLTRSSPRYSSLSIPDMPKERPEPWDMESLGEYVWVLIDQSGRVFEPDLDSESEYCWWPAKKTMSSEGKLKCIPYHFPSPSLEIQLSNPSENNVLPLTNSLGAVRYGKPMFVVSPSSYGEVQRSPRKRRKTVSGLESRWLRARSEMLDDKEQNEDDLPTLEYVLSARNGRPISTKPSNFGKTKVSTNGTEKGKSKGKKKVKESISDTEPDLKDGLDRDTWSPPPPDELLRIPGEHILCRAKQGQSTEYWIARILGYVPPTSPRQMEKYEVEFLDGIKMEVPRDWFYAYHEDGFGTCKAGKYASEFVDDPVSDDEDVSRSPSPLPATTPEPTDSPPSAESFRDLPIQEQFAYCKPVLYAVLNDRYPPTKRRHDDFMSGGKRRKGLSNEAGLRGKMDPRDVSKLQKLLSKWCLGDFSSVTTDDTDEDAVSGANPQEDPEKASSVAAERSNADVSVDTTASTAKDSKTTSIPVVAVDEFKENISPEISVESLAHADKKSDPSPAVVSPVGHVDVDVETDALPSSPVPTAPLSSSVAGSVEGLNTISERAKTPTMPLALDTSTPTIPTRSLDDDALDSPLTEISSDTESEDKNQNHRNRVDGIISRERQRGCHGYEALAGVEKVDYTLQVLLPELVRQILLWRGGHRKSISVMDDVEENELHAKAEELVREVDWVWDVKRLRDMKVKELDRKNRSNLSNVNSGGTFTRPRRNIIGRG
ncbi:hypothetical protein Moror_2747 [Moniliophthora roreri MCA 2997]|uniref:Uncharacterized protein n=1 Tax=Moniliophthora roreri (strain MCA 2997) TaxID=1381753 RepID=V2XFW6_MONRO|nr:hypothetical protein Moror_2747 [Moniliophthora roreri MCA 2997]